VALVAEYRLLISVRVRIRGTREEQVTLMETLKVIEPASVPVNVLLSEQVIAMEILELLSMASSSL
jgi:hypothetical protein